MISLFIDEKTNPYHAQLICTTHQPLLVSENVKRDQVWILNKDKFGKSILKRLSDKNFSRTKVNLTNKMKAERNIVEVHLTDSDEKDIYVPNVDF